MMLLRWQHHSLSLYSSHISRGEERGCITLGKIATARAAEAVRRIMNHSTSSIASHMIHLIIILSRKCQALITINMACQRRRSICTLIILPPRLRDTDNMNFIIKITCITIITMRIIISNNNNSNITTCLISSSSNTVRILPRSNSVRIHILPRQCRCRRRRHLPGETRPIIPTYGMPRM